MDEEGRHSDLDARVVDGLRRPHRVQRHWVRGSPRTARRAWTCLQRERTRRHWAQASVSTRSKRRADRDQFQQLTEYWNEDHGLRIHRCRAHGRAHGAAPAESRHQPHRVRHVEGGSDELAKSGAQVASSALEVANNTEVAFLSLPTPDIVQKVCAGLTGAKKMKSWSTARPRAPVSHASRTPSSQKPASSIWMRLSAAAWPARATARSRSWSRARRRSSTASSRRSSSSASCSSAAKAQASRRS